MSRPNLWFLPRAFFTARGPWGRQAPGLPCALSIFRGRHAAASLGRTALRACAVMSARSLQGGSERKGKRFHPLVIPGGREASSPESILLIVAMDSRLALRAPRNDDPREFQRKQRPRVD